MSENETVAQMLRRLGHDKNNCILCEELMGYGYCKDSPDCGAYLCKMADMVETEQRAIIDAQGGSAHNIVKRWAKRHGFPEVAKGESLTEWMRRCFLPVPRYQDGATVEPGSVSCWGTVRFAEVEASDGGWGNWHLHIDETSEVIDGTLNERVPRGLLVEGKPVREGDSLWFDTERVTVTDVDGLSDTIFTDYLTEDGEGGWIPYPFESADLSWERPAPKVLDADGVPIEVGDTVWRVNDGLRMKVRDVGDKAREHGCQVLTLLPDDDWDCCGVLHYSGKELTHSEPDSMERIRADAQKQFVEYWGCYGVGCPECPAKVGVMTPKERYAADDCVLAMKLDLISRTEEACGR